MTIESQLKKFPGTQKLFAGTDDLVCCANFFRSNFHKKKDNFARSLESLRKILQNISEKKGDVIAGQSFRDFGAEF